MRALALLVAIGCADPPITEAPKPIRATPVSPERAAEALPRASPIGETWLHALGPGRGNVVGAAGASDGSVAIAVGFSGESAMFPYPRHGGALIVFEPSGAVRWARSFPAATAIARTPAGDVVACGGAYAAIEADGVSVTLPARGEMPALWIARFSALDGHRAMLAGHDRDGWCPSVAADAAGGVVVANVAEGISYFSPDGTIGWSLRAECAAPTEHGGTCGEVTRVAIAADGSLFVSGHLAHDTMLGEQRIRASGAPPRGHGYEAFLAHVGADRRVTMALGIGRAATESVHALAPTGDGGVVFGGVFTGYVTIGPHTVASSALMSGFLGEVSAKDEILWARAIDAPPVEGAPDTAIGQLALDADGSIWIAGSMHDHFAWATELAVPGTRKRATVEKRSRDGALLFHHSFPAEYMRGEVSAIAVGGGLAYVGGSHPGAIGLPLMSLGTHGDGAAFVARVR